MNEVRHCWGEDPDMYEVRSDSQAGLCETIAEWSKDNSDGLIQAVNVTSFVSDDDMYNGHPYGATFVVTW